MLRDQWRWQPRGADAATGKKQVVRDRLGTRCEAAGAARRGEVHPARRAPGGHLSRDGGRPARLCGAQPLPRGRARPVGRDRQRAVRGDRGRCAGRRPGVVRDAAVAFHRVRRALTTPRPARRCSAASWTRISDPAGRSEAFDAMLEEDFARHRGEHHRGKYPVAHPRRDADGAQQQVRPDAADHRQQERDERRLCDHLRAIRN